MKEAALKILLATDLTSISDAAMRYAKTFLEPLNATLTLLHVIEPVGGDAVFVAEYDSAIEEANTKLVQIRNQLDMAEGQCDMKVEVGFPVERIMHAVKEENYSIVVMGMQHDLADIDREVFGSNAYDVVKHGKCAVLTVPENTPFKTPSRIVLTVSLDTQENIYLLSLLKRIARHYQSSITLLHVSKDEHINLEHKKSAAVHWLKNQLEGYDYHFATVTSKNISDAIHLFVEDHETDLLIMSPETQGFLIRLFQGSTTRKTLLHSEVPLLTFPLNYS
jgi:nucleotide-binding universal stress UspA family protein